MAFHFLVVHIILISVWVAEWPPFGIELHPSMNICSPCILTNTI